MPRPTISSSVLRLLADERRAIAADWRIMIAYMKVAQSEGFALPDSAKAKLLINKLQRAKDITRIKEVAGVYRITVPYASVLTVADEAILQEASPTAVFSHFTAAQYHNFTYELPSAFHLTQYPKSTLRLPLGTSPEDWVDMLDPPERTPKQLHDIPVHWHKMKPEWDFGYMVGYLHGGPIYVTDAERTLVDTIRFPERSGGPMEVLRIWKRASDTVDINRIVNYVEKFQQTLLRQRVGYMLERLGMHHPAFDTWAQKSVRGSSAKLFAKLDFSENFSERWSLSINASTGILDEEEFD